MYIAVISDIHGNQEALHAVLSDIRLHQPQVVYCLGDNIGYGPDPVAIIDLLRRHAILSVRGNHELAVVKPGFKKWFNPIARQSIEKTAGMMSSRELEIISGYPPLISAHGCRFVHGFPPQSSLVYHFQVADSKKCRLMARIAESVCFVGHTHSLEIMSIEADQIDHQDLVRGEYQLDREKKHIVNVGSVGQPRDGNLDAKYVLFDTVENHLNVRYVAYDAPTTVKKMRRQGWPDKHADRLVQA